MKKNIIIVILSVIIVFLIYKAMVPTVVTERKLDLKNRYSHTNLAKKLERVQNNTSGENYDSSQDEEYNDEDNYENSTAYEEQPVQEEESFWTRKISFEELNKPIKFRKEPPRIEHFEKEHHPEYTKEENRQNSENETQNTLSDTKQENSVNNTFSANLRTCKPYKETMDTEYMGVKMNYEIEILGWENNKCILNFESKMTGVGESFENQYGIDPADAVITSFAPNIRCEFTKAQLLYMGDSALQEKERNNGAKNNMLKNPNEIKFPEFEDMTIEDAKLLQVVFGSKACKMLNLDELKNIFRSLQEY